MTKKDKVRDKYYRRLYGITLKDYNKKLKAQGHACDLCRKPAESFKNRLAVDHCHKSGTVRGLLCYRCNKFLVGRNNKESATKLYLYMLKYME